MATVLLGWELGGGLGHVQRLIKVAHALSAAGHEPVLALKTLIEPWPAVRDVPFTLLQAPQSQLVDAKGFRAGSFADILAIRGFTNPDILAPMVAAWEGLVEATGAKLVIGDFAPSLVLAAYGRWPAVMVGNGFTVPPAHGPAFPPLFRGAKPSPLEGRMADAIREVQRRRGLPAPATLPELFSRAVPFACSLPELDPYHGVRRSAVAGPLASLPPPAPSLSEGKFFAYLSGTKAALGPFFEGMAAAGLHGSAYLRGASVALRPSLSGPGLELFDHPPALAEVLPRSSLVIHHAGLGVSEAALAVGRPQLLLPQHLEQELTAQALVNLGVGRVVPGKQEPAQVVQLAVEMVKDQRLANTARARATALAGRSIDSPLPAIVTTCGRLLGA